MVPLGQERFLYLYYHFPRLGVYLSDDVHVSPKLPFLNPHLYLLSHRRYILAVCSWLSYLYGHFVLPYAQRRLLLPAWSS